MRTSVKDIAQRLDLVQMVDDNPTSLVRNLQ